jgi:hypothetical protein
VESASRIWHLLTVVVWLATTVRPALAAETPGPPDAETLSRLQARFQSGRSARLSTLGGPRFVVSPVFTPEGVRAEASEGGPTMTSWSEISHVDAPGGSPGTGAVIGGLFGAAVGLTLGYAYALGNGEDGATWLGFTVATALGGALAGALVGSAVPGWTKVYPTQKSGSSWGLEKKK